MSKVHQERPSKISKGHSCEWEITRLAKSFIWVFLLYHTKVFGQQDFTWSQAAQPQGECGNLWNRWEGQSETMGDQYLIGRLASSLLAVLLQDTLARCLGPTGMQLLGCLGEDNSSSRQFPGNCWNFFFFQQDLTSQGGFHSVAFFCISFLVQVPAGPHPPFQDSKLQLLRRLM